MSTFARVETLILPQVTKKIKKEKEEIVIPLEDLSPIAHPLAQKKLLKKLHKTIKKGALRALNVYCAAVKEATIYSFETATS